MAGMYGADVEQLRALAKVFSDASDRLERDRMTVGNQIKINAWVGPVATQFRMQWDSEHSVRVASAAHLLAESATKLRKNAQEQEDASRSDGGTRTSGSGSGTGGSTNPGGLTFPELPAGADAESRAAFNALIELMKRGITDTSTMVDFTDILKVLKDGGQLGSLKGFLSEVKGLDGTAFLSILGMGVSANDLGEALGHGDTGASIESSLDLVAGAAGIWIPGAGLAWELGKGIGTGAYDTVQQFWDTPDAMYWSAARDMFGDDINANDLTQDQAGQMVKRYEGFGGYLNSISDGMRGAWRDLGDGISGRHRH
ncbi:hypothetical protein [Cryobacterium zhongshanensis]|uniref:WXG100 family type VII secretion target n=1 Tax=Cryobacterium zhongshanensis TaxID=2928153 RepID=A0AA41QUY1_9MICO|nr:hypothetical protein [Cryobacterium zhongshanensis]MCI4658196.1 hypothetical protein [Cryobacterium zhongshanensis]